MQPTIVFLVAVTSVLVADRRPTVPGWIKPAIELGSSRSVAPIPLGKLGFAPLRVLLRFREVKHDEGFAYLTTPFLRVAIAASEARRNMLPFTARDVTSDMLRPVARVYVPTYRQGSAAGLSSAGWVTEKTPSRIVIRSLGASEPTDAIQPLSLKPFDASTLPLSFLSKMGQGIVADFPLDAVRAGREFYIVLLSVANTGLAEPKIIRIPITRDILDQAGCGQTCGP